MITEIIIAKTQEDYKICDNFLSKLISYESGFDNSIMQNVKINGLSERNSQHDGVYYAYAKQNNELAGFVFAYLKNSKGTVSTTNVINLEALYIEENFRNSGIGKQLVKSVEVWAENNYSKDYIIEITCLGNNLNALDFYKHLDYKPVKIILRK